MRRPYFEKRISGALTNWIKRLTTLKTLRIIIIILQYFAHFFFAPSSVTLQNQFSKQSQSWIQSCMYIKVVRWYKQLCCTMFIGSHRWLNITRKHGLQIFVLANVAQFFYSISWRMLCLFPQVQLHKTTFLSWIHTHTPLPWLHLLLRQKACHL